MNLEYRLQTCIERYHQFYESPKGALMVNASTNIDYGEIVARRPAINELDWKDSKSMRSYAKAVLEGRFMSFVKDVDDDTIHSANVLAGTGAIAACFVRHPVLNHERETNYLDAPIRNWDTGEISRIGFDPRNPIYLAMMELLQYYIEQWDGTYAITPFVHFGPLDLAHQFRANDIMYDFYEDPDRLKEMLEINTRAILELEEYTRKTYYPANVEIPTAVSGCLVPRGSYLSCDIGDMISADLLRKFEITYVNKILEQWKSGYQHHHELGIYQIPVWAESKGMSAQFLNRDFNTTHLGTAGVINDEIIESSKILPIHFICTYDEFVASAQYWSKGKFIVNVQCDNKDQADNACLTARRLRDF